MIDLAYALAGALTGFIVGMTGVGGGALMTPMLLIVFGVSPVTAVSTDLWFAAITKILGARVHHASGFVDWDVARRLWIGSLPSALVMVALANHVSQLGKVDWLSQAIGLVVLVTAMGLLVAPRLVAIASELRVGSPQNFQAMQPALTVLSGAVLGVCVALTSVGAGALGSVMLLYIYPLRMTPHRLVATDIVHAVPLSMVAGFGYLYSGAIDWAMLTSLLAGSIPAVFVGSLLAGRVKGRWLQILLSLILIVAALKILL